jgi:protein-disulfide isomerase
MQDAAMAQALVLKYEENSKKDEVTSTPTLFINGERHSNMSYEDLKAILDEKLG